MVTATVSVSEQIPLDAMSAKSLFPTGGITVMQAVVLIGVHAGNMLYHARDVAFKLFEQRTMLSPKQNAVSFPATATGIARTVTQTVSVSVQNPFMPMIP